MDLTWRRYHRTGHGNGRPPPGDGSCAGDAKTAASTAILTPGELEHVCSWALSVLTRAGDFGPDHVFVASLLQWARRGYAPTSRQADRLACIVDRLLVTSDVSRPGHTPDVFTSDSATARARFR